MGSVSAELRIVLEGRFTTSREELPLVQVVYRNNLSWEDNPEAQKAMWQSWHSFCFWVNSRMWTTATRFLPIGAVPKSSFHGGV